MDTNVGNTEIRRTALLCKTEFVASISNQALAGQSWLRAALGDFNLWCNGLKALSSDKSSLDYRLRGRPDIREAICDLLRGLQGALHTTRQLVGVEAMTENRSLQTHHPTEEYPDSPQSSLSWEVMSDESNEKSSLPDEESSTSTLSEQISYIKTFLRQLMRISLAVRKSGNKYRFERIDATCDDQMYAKFREHLTTIILRSMEDPDAEKLDVAQKIHRASDPSRLTPVQQRLIRANMLRRHRIAVMSKDDGPRDHTDPDLDISMLNYNDGFAPSRAADINATPEPTPSAAEPSGKSTQKRPGQSINSSMVMTATEPGSNLDIKGILAKKALSGATKITRIGASQAYPRCPDFDPEGALICPYCRDPLPLDMPKTKVEDSWKAHIVQDLIPYTCITNDCDCPDEMYLTAQSLLAHMIDRHSVTRWTCDLCDPEENKGAERPFHNPRSFDTAEQWLSHFATTHGEISDSTLITTETGGATIPRSISTSERGTLAEMNKRQMIGPLSCPLCEFAVECMDTKIDDHILQHLHEFSLRALPEGSGDRLEKTAQTSQSINPLSYTQQEDKSLAGVLEYGLIKREDIQTALDEAWPLLKISLPLLQTSLHKPTLDSQPIKNEFLVEIWQTTARALLENLAVIRATLQDDHSWVYSSIDDVLLKAPEVVDLVSELNLGLRKEDQSPEVRLPDPQRRFYNPSDALLMIGEPGALRQGTLNRLEEIYLFPSRENSFQLRMVLVGSNKLELSLNAAFFAQYYRHLSESSIILWLDAGSRRHVKSSFTAIAREFVDSDFSEDPISHFLHYLNWKIETDWLMVIDKLTDDTALYLSFENLLPQGLRGTLLFTTTDESCLELFGPVTKIRVPDVDTSEEESALSSALSSDLEDLDLPEDPTLPVSRERIHDTNEEEAAHADADGEALDIPEKASALPESDEKSRELDKFQENYRIDTLGIAAHLDKDITQSDVISDADDQQYLRSKLNSTQLENQIDEGDDLKLSSSLRPPGSKYELQEAILAARQRTQTPQGQIRHFVPQEDLRRIVNMGSVTKELSKELSAIHSHQQIRSYARQVCRESEELRNGRAKIKTFRKIFALLVLVEIASLILLFLEEDVSDQDLPLSFVRSQAGYEIYRRNDQQNQTPLNCFKHDLWSPSKLEKFDHWQWEMLAPFFGSNEDNKVKHYVLEDQHILPFVLNDTDSQDADKIGSYSRVKMVRIHPDHQNLRDEKDSTRGFAVKQLHDDDRGGFKREVENLERFSGERSHPNVVSLLATYEQSNKFHLLFPRAEGDLFDLWKNIMPHPEFSYDNILWLVKQCAGIADALSKLHRQDSFPNLEVARQEVERGDDTDFAHQITPQPGKRVQIILPTPYEAETRSTVHSIRTRRKDVAPKESPDQPNREYSAQRLHPKFEDSQIRLFGRHGDVNPSNILWFGDNPMVEVEEIEDNPKVMNALRGTLKIADLGHTEFTSLHERDKSRNVPRTLTYRRPESEMLPPVVGQSYDIWSLGCVYLEFITWFLGGKDLLEEFSKRRLSQDASHSNIQMDTFFETGVGNSRVKPAVTQFIEQLRYHPKCTLCIREFLDLIEHDMIIVESSTHRCKSSKIISLTLQDMLDKCRDDKHYAAG